MSFQQPIISPMRDERSPGRRRATRLQRPSFGSGQMHGNAKENASKHNNFSATEVIDPPRFSQKLLPVKHSLEHSPVRRRESIPGTLPVEHGTLSTTETAASLRRRGSEPRASTATIASGGGAAAAHLLCSSPLRALNGDAPTSFGSEVETTKEHDVEQMHTGMSPGTAARGRRATRDSHLNKSQEKGGTASQKGWATTEKPAAPATQTPPSDAEGWKAAAARRVILARKDLPRRCSTTEDPNRRSASENPRSSSVWARHIEEKAQRRAEIYAINALMREKFEADFEAFSVRRRAEAAARVHVLSEPTTVLV